MIKKKTIKESPLDFAHPLVREWFLEKIGTPTKPQCLGWPLILAGKSTLIAAPTGSGKTLTAFLVFIDRLVKKALSGKLSNKTEIIYISPLKALNNDIHKNLTQPLYEIEHLAKSRGITLMPIQVAVRTGDTKQSERQKMLKHPPHILVTTPESLYILLTSEKSRAMLSDVKTIIVDEIHAMVNNKRGSHLALSLERLTALTKKTPMRIGLSATQKPLDLVARFLSGSSLQNPIIVDASEEKEKILSISVPQTALGPVASNEMWDEIYAELANLALSHRSTLIFVNTRRLAERISHHLSLKLGEDKVAAHHGSLSMKIRHTVENKLKRGELKALVATASLELGIDIGDIDLVCQIGSPRAINVALQRLGRSGHWHGAISKCIFFPTTRDELLECTALIYAISEGVLDEIQMPKMPLDILTQQIIATCATSDWSEKELYQLITKAYPYQALSYSLYEEILEMLASGIAGSRGRYSAYLFRDKINKKVKGRRGARLISIMNGGAIPDNGLFSVMVEPENVMIGTLDEDFAIESNRDDIILLGTSSWKVKRIESTQGKVFVEDAHGAPPSVPFWRGEAPGRTKELSFYVSRLRHRLNALLPIQSPPILKTSDLVNADEVFSWLKEHCSLEEKASIQLIEYLLQGRAVLGKIPTQDTIIAERFFDEAGGMQLIIHSPFGLHINKAWGLALRKKFCRSFNFELQAQATDNGLNISLSEQHSFPLSDVFSFLNIKTLKEVLTQAVLQSPLFKTRWRWTATRSLALPRFRHGKKVPPHIQRILSEDLLASVFPDSIACQDNLGGRDIELPSHPLIDEAMKDCLNEALDLEGLVNVIGKISREEIQTWAIDTPVPSVFSAEILNANPYAFLDDAPLEERRSRAVDLRRILPQTLLEEIGQLNPEAIEEVKCQAWVDVRNKDELHDALQTFIALPESYNNTYSILENNWQAYFEELKLEKRVGVAQVGNKRFWFAAEKMQDFLTLYPQSVLEVQPEVLEGVNETLEEILVKMIREWMSHLGPATCHELSMALALDPSAVQTALLTLESSGFILRGYFTKKETLEWCERRLLARIHRLTLDKLRSEIAPVSMSTFIQWLFKWQHVTPGTQLRGEQGLLEVIKQLQGFEIPANVWEKDIFSKRLSDFDKTTLDKLCLTGIVGWGRFSSQTALDIKDNNKSKIKHATPTSQIPITFFVYEWADWLPNHSFSDEKIQHLSPIARELYTYLSEKGASFFHHITKHIHHLNSEIENGLWELVTLGAITADSFDNLRALIYPKRRLSRHTRLSQATLSTGRWSIFATEENQDPAKRVESLCWVLLKRYGVVFRDLLTREKNIPRWRELLIAFRRLEDRGEIRGGRFVNKVVGEQFALPYAVDSLRAMKVSQPELKTASIAAADPLNFVGILVPGGKISPLSKAYLEFKDGEYIAAIT